MHIKMPSSFRDRERFVSFDFIKRCQPLVVAARVSLEKLCGHEIVLKKMDSLDLCLLRPQDDVIPKRRFDDCADRPDKGIF